MTTIIDSQHPNFPYLFSVYQGDGKPRTVRDDRYNLAYMTHFENGEIRFILLEEDNPLYDDPNDKSHKWSQYYGYKGRNDGRGLTNYP